MPLQTFPMFSAPHVGRRSALHLSLGQAVPSLISHVDLQNPSGFPRAGGLCMAGGGTPRAETTLGTPVLRSAVMGMSAHTCSPPGSEALIRRQDHSRACSTYLLTSCFLGAVPNKAANNQPGQFSHSQNQDLKGETGHRNPNHPGVCPETPPLSSSFYFLKAA